MITGWVYSRQVVSVGKPPATPPATGIARLPIAPAPVDGSPVTALAYGALFGFFTYATYDLTNHATLRNWTAALTVVDVGVSYNLTANHHFVLTVGTGIENHDATNQFTPFAAYSLTF